MDRSEGVNVAVGALLIGIAAVILGLLAPLAAGIVGAICFGVGFYLIVGGVYLGCPTPMTAVERIFNPRLENAKATILEVTAESVVFQLEVENKGRVNLDDALVNVIVPDDVDDLARCNHKGLTGQVGHGGTFWDHSEQFWNGNVSFPGRDIRFIFFRAALVPTNDLPIRFRVNSPALDDVPEYSFVLPIAAYIRVREQKAATP